MTKRILTLVAGLVLAAGTAGASPMLDFGVIAPTVGTISFAGPGNPLVGAGIDVDNVAGLMTSAHASDVAPMDAPLALHNATLNFTTGNFTGAVGSTLHFAGGGTIALVGGVPALGIPDGTTLMSGSFGEAQVGVIGGFGVAIGDFLDTKDRTLATYFGLGHIVNWSGNFNISFNDPSPAGFTSKGLLSGDIINVPEPALMLLLGSGLLGLGAASRKKKLFKS